MLPAVGYC